MTKKIFTDKNIFYLDKENINQRNSALKKRFIKENNN